MVRIVIEDRSAGPGGVVIATDSNGRAYGIGHAGVILPSDHQDHPDEYVYFLSIGGDASNQSFRLFFSSDNVTVTRLYPPYVFQDLDFSVITFHNSPH